MSGHNASYAGLFIVFEGTDGSGLSTQAALLRDWLNQQNRQAFLTKEPSLGPAGAILRMALMQRLGYPPANIHGQSAAVDEQWQPLGDEVMALLYAADRLDHLKAEIVPRLNQGIDVICDRYRMSSLAYQSLSADLDWVRLLNSKARLADLTIFLDVPLDIGKQRMAHRKGGVELYEREEKLRRIRDNYLRLIDEARREGEKIVCVDGSGDMQTVHRAVINEYRLFIQQYSKSFRKDEGKPYYLIDHAS